MSEILGISSVCMHSMRNSNQILLGDQTRCEENFTGSTANAYAQSEVAKLLIYLDIFSSTSICHSLQYKCYISETCITRTHNCKDMSFFVSIIELIYIYCFVIYLCMCEREIADCYRCQEGYDFAFVGLSVSRITQKVVNEF